MSDVVLQGELSGLPFVELLQLAVGKREKLKIEVFDAAQLFGEVYLDGALLLDARVEVLTDLPALGALLRLSEGHFRLLREISPRAGTLNRSLDDALFACAGFEDAEPNPSRKTLSSLPPISDPSE